jgi:hypothetical protein
MEVPRIFCKEIHAMNRTNLVPRCFCCTTLLGVIFMEWCFRECYANDLRTTTCSGVLGHRREAQEHRLASEIRGWDARRWRKTQPMDQKPFGAAFRWTRSCSRRLCMSCESTITISSAREITLGYLVSLLFRSARLPWGVLPMDLLQIVRMTIWAWLSLHALIVCWGFAEWWLRCLG